MKSNPAAHGTQRRNGYPGGRVQLERVQCPLSPSEVPGKPLEAACTLGSSQGCKGGPYPSGLPTTEAGLLAAAPDLPFDRLDVCDICP